MNPEINNHFQNEGYYKFSIPNFDNNFFRSEITKIKKTYDSNTQVIEIQDIINAPLWKIQFNPYILEVCNAIQPPYHVYIDFCTAVSSKTQPEPKIMHPRKGHKIDIDKNIFIIYLKPIKVYLLRSTRNEELRV